MEIRINDVPIDYRLEEESTIGEVYDGIESWLRGNGHRILDILLDGESLAEDRRAGNTQPIRDVSRLDFRVESIHRKDIDDLETIRTYLGLFQRVLRSGSDEQLITVLEELPYVLGGMKRLAPDLAGFLENVLPGPIDNARDHAAALAGDARGRVEHHAAGLDRLLEQRQRELLDPDQEMRAVLTVLSALIDRLESIPVMLQSGAEKEALTTIGTFSETVGTCIRILPQVARQHPELRISEELIPEINGFLGEIEQALGDSDLVLLGDVVEYEVVPRFRELVSSVEAIVGEPS